MGKRGVIRPLLISWRHLLPSSGRPAAAAPTSDRRRTPLFEQLEGRQLLTAATTPVVDAVWQGHNVKVVQGEYVVEFAPDANIGKLAKESSFKNVTRVGGSNFYSLSSVKTIAQMETWAANRPSAVVALTPNIVTRLADLARPNDPNYQYQWQYENTGQLAPNPIFDPGGQISFFTTGHTGGEPGTPGADISAPEAWSIVQGDPNYADPSKQIVVAVLDSGIDLNHPDLVNNIWHNPREVPNNNFDDDGDGFVDDVTGWNFVADNNNVLDDNGHGTHVSGIIGAEGNNATGVTGVIQKVKILPVKIGNSQGFLTTIDIINGIEYVTTLKNQGVNIVVANGSFGGTDFPFNRVENDAISRMSNAGVLFTVAAGNDGLDVTPGQDFPGKFSLNQPNVITVAATDNHDQIAFFSNVSASVVNIAAPGLNILSTYPTYDVGTLLETGQIVTTNLKNYAYDSGTSMAAPMVAGAIALMKAAKPDASMTELKAALLTGADNIPALNAPITAGTPFVSTAGRLNVHKAILNLLNQRTSVDSSTRGAWAGVYGSQAAVVYGDTGSAEFSNSFVTANVSGASLNVVDDTSKDPDALQSAFNRNNRVAAQLTSAGPITLDLDFSDGKSHRVSLYQANLNNSSSRQTITLVDPDSNTAIASYTTGDLATGQYQTFEINPPTRADGTTATTFRVRVVISSATPGANAVLNGLFFDPATTNDAALVAPTSLAGVTPATGGDWRRNFGSQGATVFGTRGGSTLAAKVTVTGGTQVVKRQLKNSPASLLLPKGTNDRQRAAGYVQTKTSMDIRLNLGPATKKLTVYAADLEKQGRAERLDLYDDATGALISSVDLSNFSAGKYVSWIASGKVRIHVTRLAGPTAVVGGVFVDAAPNSPIEYVGMDTASSGNWKTFYGADANFVFGSPSAPVRKNVYSADLTYGRATSEVANKVQSVTVKVTNGSNAIPHTVLTGDSRFPLLSTDGSFQRVNNPKSTGNAMNVDLKFTDQRVHTVAIYMVDPDKNNHRAQRIDLQLINPQTGQAYTVGGQIVSNFSKGKYVVFNVRQTNASVPADVRIRITRLTGPTAVVNGVFVG